MLKESGGMTPQCIRHMDGSRTKTDSGADVQAEVHTSERCTEFNLAWHIILSNQSSVGVLYSAYTSMLVEIKVPKYKG